MIVLIISFFLLALEEVLHRLSRGSSFMDVDLTEEPVEYPEEEGSGKQTKSLIWIRVGQLLVFGVLFAITAATSGFKVLHTTAGQLAALLLLIQLARISNRRIINQWSVLGSTVILQVILLILLTLNGLNAGNTGVPALHQMDWVMPEISFAVLFLLSLSFPFMCTYFLRLFSREGSDFYYFLPPLAYSEYWGRRIIRTTSWIALTALLIHFFLCINTECQIVPILLQVILVALLYTSLILFRNSCKLHHPVAFVLILIAWIYNISWLLTGL